jgi:hypothetical protein
METQRYAKIETENTRTNLKRNAGYLNPMHPPAIPIGKHPKAPEGARGP